MLVVVERKKVDLEFPMEHQKERRDEQQPWPKDRPSTEWKYWIPRLKKYKHQETRQKPKEGQKPKSTGGGKDRRRKGEERRRGDKRRESQETKAWDGAALF